MVKNRGKFEVIGYLAQSISLVDPNVLQKKHVKYEQSLYMHST